MREEWQAITTMVDGSGVDYSKHASESAARHYKEWRESRKGMMDGMSWPAVTIRLRRRYVSEWEDVEI